jgi:hypothetical protein
MGVKLVLRSIPVTNRVRDHLAKLRLSKVKRSRACAIQNPVHGYERLARSGRFRKLAIRRHAPVEAKCYEDGLAVAVNVRQPAAKRDHDKSSVRIDGTFSAAGGPIDNRPPVGNWPHYGCL